MDDLKELRWRYVKEADSVRSGILQQTAADDPSASSFFHSERSFRLSYMGFKYLSGCVKFHQFKLPVPLVSKYAMAFSRLNSPYYIGNTFLYIMSDQDAVLINLYGGINGFLDSLD